MNIGELAKETVAVSLVYLLAFGVTFELLIPVQDVWFPEFSSHASLLFLPHGVRVLSGWLLGWRSVVALTPGIFLSFLSIAGLGVFVPSRIFAILVAVFVPAATFHAMKHLNWDVFPQAGHRPCWPCVMVAGVGISVLTSMLTNYAFGSASEDYIAYLIGDVFGLFFLMLILMFAFRKLRRHRL